jgi:hypothetical protein
MKQAALKTTSRCFVECSRFLRRASRPNTPSPPAKSGKAPGSGVSDPETSGVNVTVIGSLSTPVIEVKTPAPPAAFSNPNVIADPAAEKTGCIV